MARKSLRGGVRLSSTAIRLSSSSVDVGGALGSAGDAVDLGLALDQTVRVVVLLARAVDGDLDGDLAALDLLAVHVRAGLLLQLLARERDEAEAAALAGLVALLQLAHHELGDGAQGDLGAGGRVLGEDLEELSEVSGCRVTGMCRG